MDNWVTRERAEKLLAEAGILGRLKNIGRGPLPWIGLIGNIASIFSLWLDLFPQWTIIFAFAIFTTVIATGFWHYRSRKNRAEEILFGHIDATEHLVSSFTYMHQLIHDTRNSFLLQNFQNARKNDESYNRFWASVIVQAINNIQYMITSAVGETCYTNIMIPSNESGSNSLVSSWWSENTPAGRKEKFPPTQIPIGHGIAGKAFAEMKVYVVGNVREFPGFVPRGEGEPLPYTSVISCPFRVQGKPAGVLNIDCKVENAFEPEDIKFLAQAAADTLALLLQVREYERSLFFEIHNLQSSSSQKLPFDE